ncbi:hypothetical protein Tco_1511116 [Tanacetum coccineum]
MAALRYRDENNKVGYMQKPKGGDDYHQILDFLEASHIRIDQCYLQTRQLSQQAEGVGLVLWGDLQILMDLPEVNDGISGLVIHMFVDKKYPLTINLIKRMLDHQLEICRGTVGNELTTAVQLIAFLKK